MLLPRDLPMGLWPALFSVQGPGENTDLHRHHALHLILARRGRLEVAWNGSTMDTPGFITPPNAPHAVQAKGLHCTMLFIDAASDVGRRLAHRLGGAPLWLDESFRDEVLRDVPPEASFSELEAWTVKSLSVLNVGNQPRRALDPRVRQLLRYLAEAPLDPAPVVDDLARRVHLSSSRLMHLFREGVGMPLRAYLRWLRFQRASLALMNGRTATQASSDAGFSDAAHMTRTFKQTFGVTPSALRAHMKEERPSAARPTTARPNESHSTSHDS